MTGAAVHAACGPTTSSCHCCLRLLGSARLRACSFQEDGHGIGLRDSHRKGGGGGRRPAAGGGGRAGRREQGPAKTRGDFANIRIAIQTRDRYVKCMGLYPNIRIAIINHDPIQGCRCKYIPRPLHGTVPVASSCFPSDVRCSRRVVPSPAPEQAKPEKAETIRGSTAQV
jgi:hypothetical protein